MAPHAHETHGVSVVLRGILEETSGRASEQATAGSVVIKPAGTVHANRFGPRGARLLAIEFAPGVFDDGGIMARWRWQRALPALAAVSRVAEALVREAHADPAGAENVALDLLAALDHSSGSGGAPAWVRAVRDRLEDDPGGPHRVRELAREAGVHPVYLARRFRRHYGCSVVEYAGRTRLQAAVRALADGGRPLSEVALECGFADQSHLTRALRAATGFTPARFRRLARGA